MLVGNLAMITEPLGIQLADEPMSPWSDATPLLQNTLNSLYELLPGETVLVKVASGGSPKWYRARVNNIQSTEFATVAVQFIDYGTNEVVHCSQVRPTVSA